MSQYHQYFDACAIAFFTSAGVVGVLIMSAVAAWHARGWWEKRKERRRLRMAHHG